MNIYGGIIGNKNVGTIGGIIGDFIANNIESSYLRGGMIYNSGFIDSINSSFIANKLDAKSVEGGLL